MSLKKEQYHHLEKTSTVLPPKTLYKPVLLNLPPAHPAQHEFITAFDKDPYLRFVVGACGTKFGKTFGSTIAIVRNAWNNEGSMNWWIAPTYGQSEMAYEQVKRLLPDGLYRPRLAARQLILLDPSGAERSVIEFKSGEDPDNLRGFGVDFFICDEAARVKYESFISLFTTITQTMGKGIFISTPKGRGWFYDIYQKGVKFTEDGVPLYGPDEVDPNPEWLSFRLATWKNPHVTRQAIEHLRQTLPEDTFQQEVSAQFLTDSAGVFRNITSCIKGVLSKPVPRRQYVMGVDLARLRDFSVITVADREDRHIVHFDRFNQLSWEIQYHRIIEAAKKYNNALVVMDSTGIGDPIVETIKRAGVRVEPYKIGNHTSKHQLIEKLRVSLENEQISFPLLPQLKKELEAYEYTTTENGVVRYNAPTGQNDDCVISLALTNWGLELQPFVFKCRRYRGI